MAIFVDRTGDPWSHDAVRGSTMGELESFAAIAVQLERVARDIENLSQGSNAELAVPLHDALQALHRSLFAVREAQAVAETSGFAEHWVG